VVPLVTPPSDYGFVGNCTTASSASVVAVATYFDKIKNTTGLANYWRLCRRLPARPGPSRQPLDVIGDPNPLQHLPSFDGPDRHRSTTGKSISTNCFHAYASFSDPYALSKGFWTLPGISLEAPLGRKTARSFMESEGHRMLRSVSLAPAKSPECGQFAKRLSRSCPRSHEPRLCLTIYPTLVVAAPTAAMHKQAIPCARQGVTAALEADRRLAGPRPKSTRSPVPTGQTMIRVCLNCAVERMSKAFVPVRLCLVNSCARDPGPSSRHKVEPDPMEDR
jgi:hypothetical protein